MFRLPIRAALLAAVVAAPAAVRAAEVDKLLPAESEGVVFINVRQILDSELIKKYALEQLKQNMAGEDAQKALKTLGLDPLKDVDKVVIGVYGDDPQKMKGLGVIHGKFDADKLYAAAEAESKKNGDKVTLIKDGNNTILKIQPEKNPNPIYGTLIDGTRLVFGSEKELVTNALAVAGGSGKGGVKRELATLITGMDEKASLYVAGVVAGRIGNAPIPGANDPSVQKHLEKMDNMTFTVRVTGDVNLDVTMGMKTADSADEFGKLVEQGLEQAKGFLPILTAQNPQMRPLGELAKTLTSGVKDKDIVISAKLSGSSIAKMLNPGE